MTLRSPLFSALALLLAGTSAVAAQAPASVVSDSARAEMAIGRYWHAAIVLRAEGAADGTPEDVLLLAEAEAGWEAWGAVLELLEGRDWLADVRDGRGVYLLGRALESAQLWDAAADAYEGYVALVGRQSPEGVAAQARRARALWFSERPDEALAVLGTLSGSPAVRSWAAVELVLGAVERGDTASVRSLVRHVDQPRAADEIWRAEADALLEAGDTLSATASFRTLLATSTGNRRGDLSVVLGRLRLAAGDTLGASALLLDGLGTAGGFDRERAAEALADIGGFSFDTTLEIARMLDRAGDGRRALEMYDRVHLLAEVGSDELPEWARLERARLMASVAERQDEALEEFRSIDETTSDDRIGARNLDVWRDLRRRQGAGAQAATLREWLLDRYPGSSEAIELVWSEGTRAEDRGQFDVALARYAFIAEHARTSSRAGESRMRAGQIDLRTGDVAAAARVFEAYLADFPNGRRWQEAAYWAGRTRLALGDSTVAREHLTRAVREQPTEYYAVVAADLLDVPYEVDVPVGSGPVEPAWMRDGLRRLDVLTEAGLELGALSEVAHLRGEALGDRGPMLRLADALIERGRTIDGINIGWALLEQEGSWDQQLLRVTFPFPYRELVRREAEEWGVDPITLAAIIRQESAFKADIVSRAGAIGLMQVMPPTGEELARAHGPRPFFTDALTRPEVNLHLGAAFFVEMSRRYDGDLPLVLSAYNAGPTRATRWRSYPEAADPLLLTERIPILETRGYVKNVTRNLGLYRVLYGQD